jgi:type I restriction enzyme S subunit
MIPEWVGDAIVKADCFRYKVAEPFVDPKYVMYALNSPSTQKRTEVLVHGVGRPRLNLNEVKSIPLPLPPLPEQHRIVNKIEELFSKLDAGVDELKKAKARLRKYRQELLNSAVTGELTRNWREAHDHELEPASGFIARTVAKNREYWKGRYKEPEPLNTKGLPSLPAKWAWGTLGQLILSIHAGKNLQCQERPPLEDEVGIVKISAVTWGKFNENESKTVQTSDAVREGYFIKSGDFLISRANTLELVGACVIVDDIRKTLMLSDKVLRFNFVFPEIHWILYYLKSLYGRKEIESRATGNQLSMRNISQDSIRRIPLPIPPEKEQQEIKNQIERYFGAVEHLERELEAQLVRSRNLRQAILRNGFSGRLVPQDPNDEPAERLLERIRSSRSKTVQSGRRKKSNGDTPNGK